MIILHNQNELNSFIESESWSWWTHRELIEGIKPKSYPCAVFTYWGEGANGMFLVSEIVYPEDFNKI